MISLEKIIFKKVMYTARVTQKIMKRRNFTPLGHVKQQQRTYSVERFFMPYKLLELGFRLFAKNSFI